MLGLVVGTQERPWMQEAHNLGEHVWGGVQGRTGWTEIEEGRETANVQEETVTRNSTGHTEFITAYPFYLCCPTWCSEQFSKYCCCPNFTDDKVLCRQVPYYSLYHRVGNLKYITISRLFDYKAHVFNHFIVIPITFNTERKPTKMPNRGTQGGSVG